MQTSPQIDRPPTSSFKGFLPLAAVLLVGLLAAGLWFGRDELAKPPENSASSAPNAAASRIHHATDADFQQVVLDSSVPVLVDFYADWCRPCRALGPVLEELAGELDGAKIVKVNVDHSPQTAVQFGVESIPYLVVIRDGKITAKHLGLASKSQLKKLLL